jgi:hypothetical protein
LLVKFFGEFHVAWMRLIKFIIRIKNVGLSFVYLGIESGNKTGLNVFNKHYQPEDIYRALNTLDEISMDFEYGFMLFEPDCTFDTIMKDIDFFEDPL